MQILSNFLKTGLPWILLITGIASLTIGSFVDFRNDSWEKYLTSIGGSILASGIFALILKTIQFMGVFKEELTSIIFEAKFLRNRNDLPQYWEKVTKELVKDKFPRIHQDIMKDVKETYLPTSVVAYYDNGSNEIEIDVISKEDEIIRVKQKNSFTVYPAEGGKDITHPFKNRIVKQDGCRYSNCEIKSVKVNGTKKEILIERTEEGDSIITKFEVNLGGDKNGYRVEIEMEKTYCLKYDNIIGFSNRYIMNGLRVQIFLHGIKAKFFKSGTLDDFKTIHNKDTFIEKVYSGIIYKGQGYHIFLEIK